MTNQITPIKALENQVTSERMASQLRMALPDHISVERFQRVVMTAVNKAPALVAAERTSLFTACVECAQDGLLPNGKDAALVIFNTKNKQTNQWENKVQYMPMIAGLYKRLRNSGEIKSVSGRIVYEGDEFSYTYGFENQINHVPCGITEKATHAYATAILADGTRELEVMTLKEIEEVRQTSKSQGNGPWVSFWGEMAKKTVVRRLAKRLPVSSDVERIIARDDAFYAYAETKQVPENPAPRPTRADYSDGADIIENEAQETTGYQEDDEPTDATDGDGDGWPGPEAPQNCDGEKP